MASVDEAANQVDSRWASSTNHQCACHLSPSSFGSCSLLTLQGDQHPVRPTCSFNTDYLIVVTITLGSRADVKGETMILENKVSIISGLGPGLGQELAYSFAREGSDVVLVARTESKLRQVADEIARQWPDRRVLVCPTDISDATQTQSMIDATIAEFGRIDCLVNSAYVPPPFTLFEDANFDDWRKSFDITVFGTLQLTQQVVPHMKANGGGSIVFVNSMIQKKPLATQSGYATSKGALTVAARMLAKELGAYRIRVNSTFMGWMWGPPVEGYVDYAVSTGQDRAAVIAEITKDIPLGIIPDDADCANAVAFLASDLASVITGAELDVNGGEMML